MTTGLQVQGFYSLIAIDKQLSQLSKLIACHSMSANHEENKKASQNKNSKQLQVNALSE